MTSFCMEGSISILSLIKLLDVMALVLRLPHSRRSPGLGFLKCSVKPRLQCHADQCRDQDRGYSCPMSASAVVRDRAIRCTGYHTRSFENVLLPDLSCSPRQGSVFGAQVCGHFMTDRFGISSDCASIAKYPEHGPYQTLTKTNGTISLNIVSAVRQPSQVGGHD